MTYPKTLIAKCESQGNLKVAKQSYYLYYYPRVVEDGEVRYCEKAVFSLVTPSVKGDGEEVVRSYRMIDPAQVEVMIMDLIKLWAYFKKEKDELTEFSLDYAHVKFSKKAREVLIDTLRGNYE